MKAATKHRPKGEYCVGVPAEQHEVPVGPVQKGQTWRFEATGQWTDWWIACGPEGYRNFLLHVLDVWGRLWHAPLFCLVGMLRGRPETLFRIGKGVEHEFSEDGELVVFANDLPFMYWNNRGEVLLKAKLLDGPPASSMPKPPAASWSVFRDIMDQIKGAPLVAVLTVAVSLALLVLPQGRDLVRSVSEDELGPRQWAFAGALVFLSLQAWFWPRVIINYNFGSDRQAWPMRRFLEWAPRIVGLLPFLPVIVAVMLNRGDQWQVTILLTLASVAFFGFVIFRQDLRSRIASRRQAPPWKAPFRVGGAWVSGGILLALFSLLLVAVAPVGPARALGAPAVVLIGVGLMIPPLVILVQWGKAARFPILLSLLVAAFFFSFWLDNHQVGRRAGHGATANLVRDRPDLSGAYAEWAAQFPPGERKHLVLVAAEGGASRAGFWTGEVLTALDRETGGEFRKHLFAISSVSGASVGAVGYVAALREGQPTVEALERRVSGLTGEDALSPVVAGMFYTDLVQRFLPFVVPWPDRAEALERSWERAWARPCKAGTGCQPDLLAGSYLDIWRDRTGWIPAVIVNGASEEDGRRILTSPFKMPPSVDAWDFYDLTGKDVLASTAIHNGARFPYVSPAGTLPPATIAIPVNHPAPRHILDGGYFDAAGVEVVRELAEAIREGPAAGQDIDMTIIFIGYRSERPPRESARSGSEVLAPLAGMMSSRDGHGRHLARQLHDETVARHGPAAFVEMILCDNPGGAPTPMGETPFEAPMDWALSGYAQDRMRQAIGFRPGGYCWANAAELAKVRGRLSTLPSAAPR